MSKTQEPYLHDDTEHQLHQSLIASIESKFVATKAFLQPKLKLGDMAIIVGTNRTYLSKFLNDELKITFYDYINELRLEHAITLIKAGNNNLSEVAALSGFNTYSTFRRAFFTRFGIPPSKYLK